MRLNKRKAELDAAFEHGYKLGRQGAGEDYARRAERMRRAGHDAAELDAEEQRSRDMARQAFAQAAASGRSPGAAGLLAEVERGWARRDQEGTAQ